MMTQTQTRHTHPVAFGRHVDGCPRCAELKAGAPVRKGWGLSRAQQDARFRAELAAHDCKQARCSVVCTFGDW